MYENKLANIIQEPSKFQVPHETKYENVFFQESANSADEDLFKDSDEEYVTEDKEDISLEADDKYGEEE